MINHIMELESLNRDKIYIYRIGNGTWNLYERSAFYWYSLMEGVQVSIHDYEGNPVVCASIDSWSKVEELIQNMKNGHMEMTGNDVVIKIGERFHGFPYWKDQVSLLYKCSPCGVKRIQEMMY